MSNSIVDCQVFQQLAPAPNLLQQTGAFVTQGGTNTAANTVTLLTQLADLTAILKTPLTITSIVWASSVATVTTAAAHGIPTASTVQGTISTAVPIGYDGTFPCTGVDTTHFTYPLASNPGMETTGGLFQLDAVTELEAMGNTFFAQGADQAVYVLELGVGTTAAGVTALGTYLSAPHPTTFYSYLIPMTWDVEVSAPTLFRQYESTTSKTYFYVTTTTSTYTNWTGIPTKSVALYLQSPSAPAAEFSAAAAFWETLATTPGSVTLLAPLEFRFVSGVTPYSTLTPTQIDTFEPLGISWIGTGAEGGINNTLIQTAEFGDLETFNYWYSADWAQIQCDLSLSNAIINGSNNPTNPLYYDQPGINRLQKAAQATINSGIKFGLFNAGATVTAVPFAIYVADNPSDYAIGKYAGLAVTVTPKRGFKKIVFTIVVTNIATS